jgi:hypothetical protein
MDNDTAEDNVVTRALRSVLDQVPTMPDTAIPETGNVRQQPWADVAAPSGTDKRSMEELVAEFEARIAQSPGTNIPANPGPSPSEAYFEHFTNAPEPARKRKRRRRRRPGSPVSGGPAPSTPRPQPAPRDGSAPRDGAAPLRRRRRRRRRGTGPASPPPPPA